MNKWTALLIVAASYHSAAVSQSKKEGIKVTDMLKVKSIGGVTINKSGKQVAFTVTSIEPDGDARWDYKYVNHIYLANIESSGQPKQLTTKESSSQPAWSPDGETLAFVRSVDGKSQIFLLPIGGGEPVQFTHFKYGASSPKWSPDGRKIMFSSSVSLKELLKDSTLNPGYSTPSWPIEQSGFEKNSSLILHLAKPDPDGNLDEVRSWLDNNIADKKAKIINRLEFQDETNVNGEMNFTHFFIQGLQSGAQPIELTHGFYRYYNADFIDAGKNLLIYASIDSAENPDRVRETEIFLADSLGRNLRLLLGEKGWAFSSAIASPGGNWIAYQKQHVSSVSLAQLYIMSADGKQQFPIPFDRSKGSLTWSPDEKFLYFVCSSNGGYPLYRLDMQTKKIDRLTDFDRGIGSFDIKGNHLVYVKTEVTDPFELYSADPEMKDSRLLSSFNRDWLMNKQLSIPEKHEFRNGSGEAVEYWVMKPLNFVAGNKYPLLLEIHGGPSAMWGPGESTMWHEFQFFCNKGYGVVYCNPRGSGGYGQDFLRANIKDWGAGPASDVLGALDRTIAEGWADTSKLLISGGSYAGYLVPWIIAHDHRFLAACSQRGVYDLATFFGEGNAWELVPDYFGGYPWEPETRSILQRESPITYVQQITTPYIIFHGENDRRTGFVQSEMMYRSLKVLGRNVEYVRHPGASHEITRSGDNRQRMDQMLRTYEFFERWLKKNIHAEKKPTS